MAATNEPSMIYPGGGTGATSGTNTGTGFNANMFDASGPTEYAQALGQVGQKLSEINDQAQKVAQSLQSAGEAGGAIGQATGASGVSMGSSSATHGQNQGGAFNTGGWSQNWGSGSTTSTGSSVPNGGVQAGGPPPPGGPPGGGPGGGPPPNGGWQSGAARGAQLGFDTGAAVGGGLARFGQTNMPAAVAAQWQGAQLGIAAGGGGNATMRDRQMMGIFNPSQSGIWGGSLSTTDRAAAAGQIYQMTGQTPLSQGAGQQSYQNVAGGVSGFSMLMPGVGNAQTSQMLQAGLYSPQAFQRNRAIGINTINPGGGRVNPNQVIQQVMSRTLGGQQINQATAQAMVPGNPLYANIAAAFGEQGQGNDPLTQAAATAIQAQQAWQTKNPGKPAPNPFAAGKAGQQAQNALGLANNTQWQQQAAQFTKQNAQSNTFQGANTAESTFANAVNKFYAAVDKLTGGAVGSGIGLGSGLLGHLGVGGGGLLGGGGGGILGGLGGGLLGSVLGGGGGGILGKLGGLLGGLFKGGAKAGGGILGTLGSWLGKAGGSVKDWFVNKGKDIWKNTKENPFDPGTGGGEYGKNPGEPGGPPIDVPAFGSPGPVQTSQSGDKATGPVTAGSSTSPTPQGTQAVTTAMYQPGGGSTASALKSMSDALGGIPHSVLNPDTDTDDVYHKSHQAIDLVDAIGGRDKKAVQEAAKNSHTKRDSAGLLQINKKMAQLYGPGLAELIYSGPGGINIKNGKVVDPGVYGKKVMDAHHDHVHVAATIASLKAAGYDMLGRKIKQPAQQGGQPQQGGGAAPPAGPAGPVGTINTEADFARALLTNLGVSTAPALVNAIVKWEQMEEGNWTGTPHPNLYNPLNTGRQEPGATGSSAGGMLAYPDWATGVKATADTIRQPNMKPIYDALKSGNIQQLQAALQSSPWSGSKYPGMNLGGGTAPASGGTAPAPQSPTPAPNVSQQNQQGQGKNTAATGASEGGVTSEGNILSASFAKLSEGGGGAQQTQPQQPGAQQGGAPPAPGNLMHASPAAAKAYAQTIAQQRGWNFADWDYVANAESGWRWNAANPSGAYGIPQALPGSKMASAGADWKDNAGTQINWMADYMQTRWHGAAGAAAQERSSHWYHTGLWDVPKDQLAWLQRGEMVVAQSAAQLARDKTADVSTPPTGGSGGIHVTLAAGAIQGVQGINSNLDAQKLGKQIATEIKNDEQLKVLVGQ